MICIGTDAGSKSFTIHAVNEAKKIIFKGKIRSPAGAGLKSLIKDPVSRTSLVVSGAGSRLKRIAQISSIGECLKQEGCKLAKGFFSNVRWRNQLKRMRIGNTQELILEKFMESIEVMVKAESELTAKITMGFTIEILPGRLFGKIQFKFE